MNERGREKLKLRCEIAALEDMIKRHLELKNYALTSRLVDALDSLQSVYVRCWRDSE